MNSSNLRTDFRFSSNSHWFPKLSSLMNTWKMVWASRYLLWTRWYSVIPTANRHQREWLGGDYLSLNWLNVVSAFKTWTNVMFHSGVIHDICSVGNCWSKCILRRKQQDFFAKNSSAIRLILWKKPSAVQYSSGLPNPLASPTGARKSSGQRKESPRIITVMNEKEMKQEAWDLRYFLMLDNLPRICIRFCTQTSCNHLGIFEVDLWTKNLKILVAESNTRLGL